MIKHNGKIRLTRFTIICIVVLVAVAYIIVFHEKKSLSAQEQEYRVQLEELKCEQEQLEKEDQQIEEYEEYTKSRRYIENMARQKLGLVYPGEVVFEPKN